jgi:exopolyphosphatase / guanosine-5'-triphosphate,3'-diphosphate pyrophosphatase
MDRRAYPLTVLHEYRMTAEAVSATHAFIQGANLHQLRQRCDLSEERISLVPIAVQVLDALVQRFQPKDITISSYGIREGMLYEQMPAALRESDPLIAACRFAEQKDARLPGFGDVLYDFVRPLFPEADWQRLRIIRAACLLHDVSWRGHPDYRDEAGFDLATRANLGGIKHSERVLMGLALLHRYSNKREGSRFGALFALLSEEETRTAEILGKAMRLGAMLWLGAHDAPGAFLWRPAARRLDLHLEPRARPLWGEVAQSRLGSLAHALGATAEVSFGA